MPRSFALSVDSTVGVDQILWAFGHREYWRARLGTFGEGTATLDAHDVDSDGTVTLDLTLGFVRDRLPKVVAGVHRGELAMVQHERWTRIGDGRGRGEITVTVPGAPVHAFGEVLLLPTDHGARGEFTTTVQVKIPLIGGQLENLIGNQLGDEIREVQRFTGAWVTENS
ncbi:DUF2505 domain-containing protein [Mycobacterium sp.]|uniref:DUF2505 domain-containing protein n=1 Tax=Mycobacterium sp. TaxID=1785 RepID=UPI0031D8A248